MSRNPGRVRARGEKTGKSLGSWEPGWQRRALHTLGGGVKRQKGYIYLSGGIIMVRSLMKYFLLSMPETPDMPDHGGMPLPEVGPADAAQKPAKKEVRTWNDLSEE